MIPEQRPESDASRFATRPAQRITELRNDHVRRAADHLFQVIWDHDTPILQPGDPARVLQEVVVGMWKEWGLDRHSDADPLIVLREFTDRVRRYA